MECPYRRSARGSSRDTMSVPQLFEDLCTAHMVANFRRPLTERTMPNWEAMKSKLKKSAYTALFRNVLSGEGGPRQETVALEERSPTVKTRLLMVSFDMRVRGRGGEADRLEELGQQLEDLADDGVSATVVFLLELVDSGGALRSCGIVPKRYGDDAVPSRVCRFKGYQCCDLNYFEADCFAQNTLRDPLFEDEIERNMQLFTSTPGSGLAGTGLFKQNTLVCNEYEKQTHLSLFGALVHTKTMDMDIKLDLPSIPNNVDITGLSIKVPSAYDLSDDEGFQSASNLTPDSQVESHLPNLWEAALTHTACKNRTWEWIGCGPRKSEKPFVTEAGSTVFDRVCSVRRAEAHLLRGTTPTPMSLVPSARLIQDSLNVLLGVVSRTFSFHHGRQAFVVRDGVAMSGLSTESLHALLGTLAECGTLYWRLCSFTGLSCREAGQHRGFIFQAFVSGIRRYLQYYKACVLSAPPSHSLLSLSHAFRQLTQQLRYMNELCRIHTDDSRNGTLFDNCPNGVQLLSYLYKEALCCSDQGNYYVILSLLRSSCEPYTRFIQEWVYSGLCRDVYGEFMIRVNEDYLLSRDKHYWGQGYVLAPVQADERVPFFLGSLADDIYVCGKTINLLRLCQPQNYVCCADVAVPQISVTFSLAELVEIERSCADYTRSMERIAWERRVARAQQEERAAVAREELAVQVYRTMDNALGIAKGHQMAQAKAFRDAKKRVFQELQDQYNRSVQKQQTDKDNKVTEDAELRKKMLAQHELLSAEEGMLKNQAREELVALYGKLYAEARKREHRAQWRGRRLELHDTRTAFLERQRAALQDELKLENRTERSSAPVVSGGVERREVDSGGAVVRDAVAGERVVESLESRDFATEDVFPGVVEAVSLPLKPTTPCSLLGEHSKDAASVRCISPTMLYAATTTSIADRVQPLHNELETATFTAVPHVTDITGSHVQEAPDIPRSLIHLSPITEECDVANPQSEEHATLVRVHVETTHKGVEAPTSQETARGRDTKATVRVGEGAAEGHVTVPVTHIYGHVSQSSIRSSGVLATLETMHIPKRKQTNAHVSDSTIGHILNPGIETRGDQIRLQMKDVMREKRSKEHPSEDTHLVELDANVPGDVVAVLSSGDENVEPVTPTSQHLTSPELLLSQNVAQQFETLANMYEADKYQDGFPSMSSPPVAHLLQAMVHHESHSHAPAELPTGTATDHTAVTASQRLPLPVLVKRSIISPILAQISIVNKAIVEYYIVDLNVKTHFEALKHFVLLEDGEFAHSLSEQLFAKLASGPSPAQLLSPMPLNAMLGKALQESQHGDSLPVASLSLAVKRVPDIFKANDPDALNCLQLGYKVDWPLNIVITDSCLTKYNKVFSVMLQLERMVWTLKDVWFHLKSGAFVKPTIHSTQFHQLQLFRHEMQHFVKVIQGYIMTQILHVSWSEFQANLKTVKNLDDLHRIHAEYLNTAIFRGLLTEKAAPVMNVIRSIFSLILRFHTQLVSRPWDCLPHGATHPNFALLRESHQAFKYYSHFLHKVVTKLVSRGYQPHLEDFLVRINFNSFYTERRASP
ncbi:gamma-tubulin complex component 6 isoform X2 [Lethenteron reissneri]|uniref:gamma-tubulin complex component 6 isoform X2 n=1 Tax=Lethenteron reissneri TaxID=7753 RepID=UPI002AB6ED18|nr:gamma-tubulin complex component 6 isoform X2 [Lethenteron reissneri]